MVQTSPDTFGDYTEVECSNDNCGQWVTVHVDNTDESFECWACNDDNGNDGGNVTAPRVGDHS